MPKYLNYLPYSVIPTLAFSALPYSTLLQYPNYLPYSVISTLAFSALPYSTILQYPNYLCQRAFHTLIEWDEAGLRWATWESRSLQSGQKPRFESFFFKEFPKKMFFCLRINAHLFFRLLFLLFFWGKINLDLLEFLLWSQQFFLFLFLMMTKPHAATFLRGLKTTF